jgi:hypothetical protein
MIELTTDKVSMDLKPPRRRREAHIGHRGAVLRKVCRHRAH